MPAPRVPSKPPQNGQVSMDEMERAEKLDRALKRLDPLRNALLHVETVVSGLRRELDEVVEQVRRLG